MILKTGENLKTNKAMITVKIYKDNELKKEFNKQETDFCAFKWLLDNQGQSCSWAIKHEGWKVELIDEDTNEAELWKP